MAGEFVETNLGRLLSFANGRSSPDRADGLPYPVYGSNGVIGYANESNADADSIIIGRVGSYCGSLYLSKRRCWVTDNERESRTLAALRDTLLPKLISGELRVKDSQGFVRWVDNA